MTVDRDDYLLRNATRHQIEELSREFDCTGDLTSCHSRPILLLHIPLYRKSEENCANDYDATPESMKWDFRVGFHCLSNASTHYILEKLKPRAIFDGHTHYSCRTWVVRITAVELG
uniref:Calcineurin-like phosphoesterase domain-containing protein n=1 Tax=Setaria digitata TaxID=48799 RepID=A0A915PLI1_9BILA